MSGYNYAWVASMVTVYGVLLLAPLIVGTWVMVQRSGGVVIGVWLGLLVSGLLVLAILGGLGLWAIGTTPFGSVVGG